MKDFKYIYGPVPSWRLGSSLGIDLLSEKDKICTFNCTYCQIGETLFYTTERKVFVSTKKVIEEIKALPEIHIDYITFSGRGEPTLAKNLGEAIKEVKKVRKEPIAVLTNSSLISREDVRKELIFADLVACKIDASSNKTFALINRPDKTMRFESILDGIKNFRKIYKKKLALQVMFMEENKDEAQKIAELAANINPDEVQINTPLRPSRRGPLSKSKIAKIKEYFKNFNVVSVYDAPHIKVESISTGDTLRRRGKVE
ncbi:MAG: radical SAM protein [Candidatus Omnitrophica bacterium]|nr:radical SAM protein [Candidatus Omnitrophota bacterium]